ncbi:MAG TPA: metallophosphoesterase [Vicinamibacterales bacterium]|nr:metallophosphoesterase [Vicinamibacterales bacterium]
MDRRSFLTIGAVGAVGSMLPSVSAAADSFSFVHFTDVHIQPELHAGEGSRKCISKINTLKPDFALCGGDLVFDACAVGKPRANQVFDLYAETIKPLQMPVHTIIGNHDVFGISTNGGVTPADPMYGKRMFEDRVGPLYSSFDYKGWHFVLLDSIRNGTPGREFIGYVSDEQIAWLKKDLAGMKPGSKLVVVTHIPLVSGVLQLVPDPGRAADIFLVTNAQDVLNVLWPYKPKLVLQGHTHIRETVIYNGCQFVTSGAVCGNWWKGPRDGHPEGFGVLTVRGDEVQWRYETYGFVADKS